jgi:aminoglycoside 2''-phosphotransferase
VSRLHSINDRTLPETSAPVTLEAQKSRRRNIEQHVYPLLLPHQRIWAEQVFDSMLHDSGNFEYAPVLIHGDLAPYHIFFDSKSLEITGVIDFGVAGLGDPANDIACLIMAYGESFVAAMRPEYPTIDSLLPRARFYAGVLEMEWIAKGIQHQQPFWFTAHFGGARDLS